VKLRNPDVESRVGGEQQDASASFLAEESGKALRNPEQCDGDRTSRCAPRIASQTLCPRETNVSTLCARKDHVRWSGRSGRRWWHARLDPLVSHELQTGAPMLSAAPVLPKQRLGTNLEGMEEGTDSTRFRCRLPVPLTLLAHRATATIANSGTVKHAQAPIGFPALLSRAQRFARRTGQSSVGLEGEVLAREPTGFPGQGNRRRAVALHRHRRSGRLWGGLWMLGANSVVRCGVGES
jgi:hypothetical protein